jgi:hypothetical protein
LFSRLQDDQIIQTVYDFTVGIVVNCRETTA